MRLEIVFGNFFNLLKIIILVCRLVNSTEPNVFLSASWDTTVKMWFISDKQAECILTIKSHQLSVWAVLHMKCNLILSGSADKTIRVFSANGSLIKIFTGNVSI